MNIGIWQVVLVLLIVLILFGAGKLPKVMGDVAKGVKSFKAGLKDDDEVAEDAEKKPAAKPLAGATNESAAHEATTKNDEPARS